MHKITPFSNNEPENACVFQTTSNVTQTSNNGIINTKKTKKIVFLIHLFTLNVKHYFFNYILFIILGVVRNDVGQHGSAC